MNNKAVLLNNCELSFLFCSSFIFRQSSSMRKHMSAPTNRTLELKGPLNE